MLSVPKNNLYVNFVIVNLPSPIIYSYTKELIPMKDPIRVISVAKLLGVKII